MNTLIFQHSRASFTRTSSRYRSTHGFTLIEIVTAVLLGSILFLALTQLLSSGMRVSQKGSSHLTNMQAAAILLSQIESDLALAVELDTGATSAPGAADTPVEVFSIKIAVSPSNVATPHTLLLKYQPSESRLGFERRQADAEPYRFCAGLQTQVTLRRVVVPTTGHRGALIEVRVKTPPLGTEETVVARFVPCHNLPANRALAAPGWTW
ncbi:MAG TPA: prepilin-type N-terminal cleavage/methylation domain-containing protein [Candidatus Ozemobacteraceae bacterium]|nr:prepilin-type N-terminal cleavage/methylation domain-containing protein [Candidatus Ozemobacteraceae bacterium]